MMHLTESQKKHLRRLAHPMKPAVMVGKEGLSDRVLSEITSALKNNELIKIKVRADDREKRNTLIEEIAEKQECVLVHRVGNTATLYKRHSEKPKIELPTPGSE